MGRALSPSAGGPAAAREFYPPVSSLRVAFALCCPRCGQGRLLEGFLTVRPVCEVCGLDLSANDAGDGPAVFAILLLGILFVPLAFWLESRFAPPMWVHLVLWPPLILILAIGMLRPMKGWLIAQQYKLRSTSAEDA